MVMIVIIVTHELRRKVDALPDPAYRVPETGQAPSLQGSDNMAEAIPLQSYLVC
jgi:hypothetical protein